MQQLKKLVFSLLTITIFLIFGMMVIFSAVSIRQAQKTRQMHVQALKDARITAQQVAKKNWQVKHVDVNTDSTSRFVLWMSMEDQFGQTMVFKIPSFHEGFSQFCQLKPGQKVRLAYSDRSLEIDRGGGKEPADRLITRFLIPEK